MLEKIKAKWARFCAWAVAAFGIPPRTHEEPFIFVPTPAEDLEVGDFIFCGYIQSITGPDTYTGQRLCRAGFGPGTIQTVVLEEDEIVSVRKHNPEYRG